MSQAAATLTRKFGGIQEGDRYGRLTAIKPLFVRDGGWVWKFKCDCGNDAPVRACCARRGDTRSCGCLRKQVSAARAYRHGKREAPEYYLWINMVRRCTNAKDKRYCDYGGRGIKVCERWAESFQNFYDDLGPRPSREHSIERADNNGDYTPDNCFWATKKQQGRNKRNNRLVVYGGIRMPLVQAAEMAGRDYQLVHSRLKHGWSLDRALAQPSRGNWKGMRV